MIALLPASFITTVLLGANRSNGRWSRHASGVSPPGREVGDSAQPSLTLGWDMR